MPQWVPPRLPHAVPDSQQLQRLLPAAKWRAMAFDTRRRYKVHVGAGPWQAEVRELKSIATTELSTLRQQIGWGRGPLQPSSWDGVQKCMQQWLNFQVQNDIPWSQLSLSSYITNITMFHTFLGFLKVRAQHTA